MQAQLRNGKLAEESTRQTAVRIIKGERGYFREIDLDEVLWKAGTSLLNCQLTAAIKFYDVMHNFWEGRLTGTLVLEANLLQHLRAIREAVIFEVFLDL